MFCIPRAMPRTVERRARSRSSSLLPPARQRSSRSTWRRLISTIVAGAFMLDLNSMITAPLSPAPASRGPRRLQPASAQGETPSTLTPNVLSTAPSTITNLPCPSLTGSMSLVTGDMRREIFPISQLVTSRSEHDSSQCFSIADWS